MWHHAAYVFRIHGALICFIQVQGLMVYSLSVKEIFIPLVTHKQFSSIQLTQKSKQLCIQKVDANSRRGELL